MSRSKPTGKNTMREYRAKRLLNNYRSFFNRLCRLPFWERIKTATRIIFKREYHRSQSR